MASVSLSTAELLVLLASRDARLTAQEQAVVRAALAGAPPELRAELERRLGRCVT